MFMPGKPQVWYLDLFAGKNDYEAVKRAGEGGHKEINRTNLSVEQIENAMQQNIVQKQLELIRFRNQCPAFGESAKLTVEADGSKLEFVWENNNEKAILQADFETDEFTIKTE